MIEGDPCYLYLQIMCNQDDEIEFLVKHKIPFRASCHYGHESVFYSGKGEPKTFPNQGVNYETYGAPNEDT